MMLLPARLSQRFRSCSSTSEAAAFTAVSNSLLDAAFSRRRTVFGLFVLASTLRNVCVSLTSSGLIFNFAMMLSTAAKGPAPALFLLLRWRVVEVEEAGLVVLRLAVHRLSEQAGVAHEPAGQERPREGVDEHVVKTPAVGGFQATEQESAVAREQLAAQSPVLVPVAQLKEKQKQQVCHAFCHGA